MEKNNILDIGIASVRRSGKTNMFDRTQVQHYAYQMGFFELVTFIEEHPSEYFTTLLTSIDYEVCPSASPGLLEYGDESEARNDLAEEFEDEIADYQNHRTAFEPTPFTLGEFHQLQKEKGSHLSLIEAILRHPDAKHPFTHSIPSMAGIPVVWFKDGFYLYGESGDNFTKLTIRQIKLYQEWIDKKEIGLFRSHFARIEEHYALRNLLT